MVPLKVRRLLADIEVSPNIVLAWRAGYDLSINPESIIQERKIICIAYRWHGEKKTTVLCWDRNQDDRKMLKEFVEIANEADEVIFHHGDKFDVPWIRARCLIQGLGPIPDWKTVDTKKLAAARYLFNANKLDYLAKLLGVGEKRPSGYDLWKDILLKKCPRAMEKMKHYCAGDVEILEGVYDKLVSGAKPKTHVGVLGGRERWTCPRTGSRNVSKSKTRVSAAGTVTHQMRENETGTYFTINDTAYRQYLKEKTK